MNATGLSSLASALPLANSVDPRPIGKVTRTFASAWTAVRPAVFSFPPILLLLLGLALFKHLDHDENQFIASGAILARNGLLPYRDYPYFHVPNLIYLYAALDRLSPWLLLNARIFNCICSAMTLSILFALVYRWYSRHGKGIALTAATLLVAGVMTNPIFEYTTGKAWNHDLPVLLTLGALLAVWRWHASFAGKRWAALAGLLLGLAVGTRLTFAPVVVAFLAAFFGTARFNRRQKLSAALTFLLALFIAMWPSWRFLLVAPRQFLFGNFRYPYLNTLSGKVGHYPRGMTVFGKLLYCFTDLLARPGTASLFVVVVVSIIGLAGTPLHPRRFQCLSLLSVTVSLLAASFAPTPLWTPYFFAPIPFAAMFVACVAANDRASAASQRTWSRCLVLAVLLTVGWGAGQYRTAVGLCRPNTWYPVELHRAGVVVASLCNRDGPVLTFAPIIPLEGGRPIYPAYTTGPFAARAAAVASDQEENDFHLFDEDDLKELTAAHPPAAVLTGMERHLDDQLTRFAAADGMLPYAVQLPMGQAATLWLKP